MKIKKNQNLFFFKLKFFLLLFVFEMEQIKLIIVRSFRINVGQNKYKSSVKSPLTKWFHLKNVSKFTQQFWYSIQIHKKLVV